MFEHLDDPIEFRPDADLRAVVSAVRSEHVATSADTIDPFDTPSTAAVQHAMHESGYGHGV